GCAAAGAGRGAVGPGGHGPGGVGVGGAGPGGGAWTFDSAVACVDGWGHLLGDAGSGFWVGRRGLDAALRAHDGRSGGSPLLARLVERDVGPLDRLPEIAARARAGPVAAIASFPGPGAQAAARRRRPDRRRPPRPSQRPWRPGRPRLRLHQSPPGRDRLMRKAVLLALAVVLLPGCSALTPSAKGSSARGPLRVWIMEPGSPELR